MTYSQYVNSIGWWEAVIDLSKFRGNLSIIAQAGNSTSIIQKIIGAHVEIVVNNNKFFGCTFGFLGSVTNYGIYSTYQNNSNSSSGGDSRGQAYKIGELSRSGSSTNYGFSIGFSSNKLTIHAEASLGNTSGDWYQVLVNNNTKYLRYIELYFI